MTKFGFRGLLRGAVVSAAVGITAGPVVAQDEAAQPDSGAPAADATDARLDATPAAVQQDSIAAYQVRTGDTDYLPGRIQVADPRRGELRAVGKTGLLIIQGGRIVGRAETGIGGVAQIPNLSPGAYSVIAIGPDGMGAFGMEVLPTATGVAMSTYRFDSLLVPANDMAVAQQLISGAMAPAPGPSAVGQPVPPIPASLKQGDGFLAPAPIAGAIEDDGAEAAAPIHGDRAVIRGTERLVSHLVVLDSKSAQPVPFANSRVFFLRDGQLLGTVETNSEGYCGATGVEDGIYSMVGIGPQGFLALGVQVTSVVGTPTAGSDAESRVTYVSLLQGGIPTVHLRAAAAGNDALPFAPGFGMPGPFGPGGFGGPGGFPGGGGGGPFGGGGSGGGFGGGGGLGGGGLLGALLGAGLGAGLGAALGDDDGDDGEGFVPPPQRSPFSTPGQGPPIIPPGQGGTPPGQDNDD